MATAMHPQPQHLTALQQANEIRLERARLCRELYAGELTLADVIDHDAIASMRIVELVRSQHRYGYRRAEKVCDIVGCNPQRRVGELTARQRAHIVDSCA